MLSGFEPSPAPFDMVSGRSAPARETMRRLITSRN